MAGTFPLTLASWVDLVIPAIGIIIFVGGAIANAMRKSNAPNGAGGSSADFGQSGAAAPSGKEQLEAMAARRRQQLQELAQQRRGGSAPPGTRGPENLTAAEAAERARNKTLYERRAEALRQQQAQRQAGASRPPLAQQPPQQPTMPSAAQEELQRLAMARKRAEQERQMAELQRQRRIAEDVERRRAAAARRAAQTAQRAKPAPTVHRNVEDVPVLEEPVSHISAVRASLRGESLRQAIIAREILGRPIGMRRHRELDDFI